MASFAVNPTDKILEGPVYMESKEEMGDVKELLGNFVKIKEDLERKWEPGSLRSGVSVALTADALINTIDTIDELMKRIICKLDKLEKLDKLDKL